MSEPANPEVEILNAALELREPERSAYLDKTCAGNAALRQRVLELLQAHEQAENFLEAPPSGRDLKRTVRMDVPLTEKPGDRIGRYKLLQQIGEGGCGVVYMAEQEEPVRRRVAIKVIKLGMDTKSVIARFEAERQALALMDHPNIAKVFDAGSTERPLTRPTDTLSPGGGEGRGEGDAAVSAGRPYFVMELVRGIKITDYCDENKISTEDRLKLFIQVCQAIQHAHQKGIIHRDIKPSNILVTINDGVPVPKVIDFGIAKATQGRLTDKTLFTAFEQFIGTPAYMSPEQAVMTSLDIDTRSDIYSLGVLLYELLTGKTPFDANKLLQSGLDEMRRTIREVEPPKPSTRLTQELTAAPRQSAADSGGDNGGALPRRRYGQIQELIHLVRGDLDWIVMKSLEKDRARRYETANGLAADVQRHLNNEPVNACPPSGLYRLQKAVRRNKTVFATAAAIAVVLVVGVIVSISESIRATRAEREQIQLRLKAETNEKKSEQVAQFLEDMLKGVAPSAALGRDTTMLREILDKTASRLATDLKGQPLVEAELRNTIGDVYLALNATDKAEAMHREALTIRQRLLGGEHPAVAESLYKVASDLWKQGKLPQAEAIHREALAMRRKLLGSEHPDVASSLNNLGRVLYLEGKLTEAESQYREALAIRRKNFGNASPLVATTLKNLSGLLIHVGKLDEADSSIHEALAIQTKSLGDENQEVVDCLGALGQVLRAENKLDEAETVFRKFLFLRRKFLGDGHPDLTLAIQRLGDVLTAQGKLDEAETLNRESAKALRASAENGDAGAQNSIAWSMATSADPNLRDGSNAVGFAEKAVSATDRKDANYLDTLAAAYAEVGQFTNAIAAQREAVSLLNDAETNRDFNERLKLYEANIPYHDHLQLAIIASGLLAHGKYSRAEPFARECLALREKVIPGDWRVFNAQSMLGGILLGQEKFDEAEQLLFSGYEGMKQREKTIPAQGKMRPKEAVQRLVQLYEATDRPDQAAEWKLKLAQLDEAESTNKVSLPKR